MVDVQERLERLAADGTPRGATAVMEGARRSLLVEMHEVPRARSEWRARRGVLIGAVVVVVAVVLASVAVVTRDTSNSSDVLPVVSDTATYRDLYDTNNQALDGPIYLVPSYVPDGFTVLRVDDVAPGGGGGGSPEVDHLDIFARFDAAGERVQESFELEWGRGVPALNDLPGASSRVQSDDPLAAFRSQGAPTTVRGIEGLISDSGASHFVAWEEPAGRMVAVSSPTVSAADLLTIADTLAVGPDNGFEVTRAPEGFVQIASQPGMASSGTTARDVVYGDGSGRGFIVRIDDHSESSPGANLLFNGSPFGDARLVDVNGHHAVVGAPLNSGLSYDQQTMFLSAADQNVQWLEPANTAVTVSAAGLSEDDVLAIARGLRTVDRNEWERLLVTAPGRIGVAPVTPSGPEPTFTGDEGVIADVFRTWVSRPDVDTTVSILEDGDALRGTIEQVRTQDPGSADHTARVDAVQLVDDTHARVTFSIFTGSNLTLANQQGVAVKIDGTWRVSRATYCATISLGTVRCPPG